MKVLNSLSYSEINMNELRVWFGALSSRLGNLGENAKFVVILNYGKIYCSTVLYLLINVLEGSEQFELLKEKYLQITSLVRSPRQPPRNFK